MNQTDTSLSLVTLERETRTTGTGTARERRNKRIRRVRFDGISVSEKEEGSSYCGHLHMTSNEMTDDRFLEWVRASKAKAAVRKHNEGVDLDIDIDRLTEEAIDKQMQLMSPGEIAQLIEAEAERRVQLEGFRRDRKSRDSILSRLRKQSKAPQAYDFDIREGREVSHKGKLYTVMETTGSDAVAITAKIKPCRDGGPEQWVVANELRPSATPRPVKTISNREVKEDDFVLWEGEDSMKGGIVTTHDEQSRTVIVHEYEGTAGTSTVWLPIWEKKGRKDVRKARCPKGMNDRLRELRTADLAVIGELTETNRLAGRTLDELEAKGFNNR
jgi:hypothetical protein